MVRIIIALGFFCPFACAFGQPSSLIQLCNPSFELDRAGDFNCPPCWDDLTPSLRTSSRLCPIYTTFPTTRRVWDDEQGHYVNVPATEQVWQKSPKPAHGDRFTSLLASDLGQKQSLTQVLEGALEKGRAYTFSIELAWAKKFLSTEENNKHAVNYDKPLRLFIWGGTKENPKAELLATTTTVGTKKWKKYFFVLKPSKADCNALTFEAEFAPEIGTFYNGNILLDHCSHIEAVNK